MSASDRARPWNLAVWIVTIAVVLLVGIMNRVTIPTPNWWNVSGLPAFHAVLNSLAALAIIVGGIAIKQGKKSLHRTLMMTAFVLSTLFLLSYVTYHFTSGHTYFGDINQDGIVSESEAALVSSTKPLYLILLTSHILLAVVSFPLILFSITAAAFQQFERHVKFTRWAYPLWLYVAVTGPILFFLIRPYY